MVHIVNPHLYGPTKVPKTRLLVIRCDEAPKARSILAQRDNALKARSILARGSEAPKARTISAWGNAPGTGPTAKGIRAEGPLYSPEYMNSEPGISMLPAAS
jgi:hypothetical protein